MLHVIACLWGVSGTFNLDSNVNWIIAADIQDKDIVYQYITSLYWAAQTIMTVGYGDILPQSGYEKMFTVLVLVIGVAMFSYTLSTLANQF